MEIDVEEVFADFVEDYGGVVSDSEPGQKKSNADYIFHDAKVVAELKILKEDPFQNKEFKKSQAKKEREWVQKGYITPAQLNAAKKLSDLPDKCWRDIEKLYVRPLITHVEKANKQIKSSKATLGLNDYKGLLLLVSDGNFLLDPKNIRMALAKLFSSGRYSGINTVTYLTVNVVTTRPDDRLLARLWTNFWRDADNMDNEVPLEFLNDLYNKWADYYSKVSGIKLLKVSEVDERGLTEKDYLKTTKFVRRRKSRA